MMRSITAQPRQLAFFIAPQFSLMAFSAALEPLRAANRLSGSSHYQWQLVSMDGQPVTASNGVQIAVHSALDALQRPDMLVVCVGLEPLQFERNRGLHHRLRRFAQHGCQVGAISAGTFVLADAGLLTNRVCTVHWEYHELFASRHPEIKQTQDLYVIDRDVFTCSGGTAALDMMLHFVQEQCGPELALAVAEQFLHPRIREQGDDQRMELHTRYRVHDPKLVEVIRLMESTIDGPLYIQAIAARVGLSPRQVERLFRQHIGEAPGPFYLRMRLERGRTLLVQTSQSIQEIALACGFGSTSHFAHAYRRCFQRTPTDERRRPVQRAS
ncbi:MAG: GlxA family transcriptional regulator [Steroidobacteraceae bacterium]